MGGCHSPICNNLTKLLWFWAMQRNIWLSAAYIPGRENRVADFHSRCFKDNTEWTLDPATFAKICQNVFLPEIDLFASLANRRVEKYISWYPEVEAWAVDAFSVPWTSLLFCVFPTFSMVAQVLGKVNRETASGIMVVPRWTTQAWFPVLLNMLVDHPRHILPRKDLLTVPHKPGVAHPSQ